MPENFDPDTLFFGVDLMYSSAFVCIFTSYLAIIYQRVHFKGQLFFEVFPFDTKLKQFARFFGRFAVMFTLGTALFWLFTKTIPAVQKSPIGIWEIYFLGVLIPYSVGSFLVFAFGDWVCLKLKLYKKNDLFGLGSVDSEEESYGKINLSLVRNTGLFGTTTRESEQARATLVSSKNKDISA